jgi:hypothetical protein
MWLLTMMDRLTGGKVVVGFVEGQGVDESGLVKVLPA